MSDEIKENNTPNHILSALGDLTNGAINYYQLPKTTLEEQKMILDYITNLQQENDRLNEENKKFNKWIETLNKENHRLNNIINELEEWLEDNIFNKVGSSVDIAIENHTYCKVLDKLKELKENNNEI